MPVNSIRENIRKINQCNCKIVDQILEHVHEQQSCTNALERQLNDLYDLLNQEDSPAGLYMENDVNAKRIQQEANVNTNANTVAENADLSISTSNTPAIITMDEDSENECSRAKQWELEQKKTNLPKNNVFDQGRQEYHTDNGALKTYENQAIQNQTGKSNMRENDVSVTNESTQFDNESRKSGSTIESQFCSFPRETQKILNQHILKTVNDKVKDTGVHFQCTFCGDLFRFRYSVQDHICKQHLIII